MKRIYKYLCAGLLCACMAACSNPAKDGLSQYAKLQNESCPQVVDTELILADYEYSPKANVFTLNYSVREIGGTVESMRQSEEPLRRIIGQNFHDESLKELLDMLVEAEAVLKVRFIGEITADTLDIDFNVSDLRNIKSANVASLDDLQRLQALVANENSRCPQYISGDSLVISSMTIEKPYIVLTYSFDPKAYNFASLDSAALRAIFEPGLRQILDTDAGREELQLMKKLKLGMRYSFEPKDSLPPFHLDFPPAEIASY